jgi:hypothetical protein
MSSWPKDTLTEKVFINPAEETIEDGWYVFGKMKTILKDIIASKGGQEGVAPLDKYKKIPKEYIPTDILRDTGDLTALTINSKGILEATLSYGRAIEIVELNEKGVLIAVLAE